MEATGLQRIQEELGKGKTVCQVVVARTEGSTPRNAGAMMVVNMDGSMFGSVGVGRVEYEAIRHASALMRTGQSELKEYCIQNDDGTVSGRVCLFFKVFAPRDQLVIFGGGHVGYQLYLLARHLHFSIVLADEREGFLTRERYPDAALFAGPFSHALGEISFHENTYVVVASSSHQSDEDLVYALSDKECAYLGMLGSQKKVDGIVRKLRARGVSQAKLNALYAPIGIPLGGRQPEEVALSILAQVVKVRSSLRNKEA